MCHCGHLQRIDHLDVDQTDIGSGCSHNDQTAIRIILILVNITESIVLSSFGRSKHDEMSILTPVMQCCLIRFSTFEKLMKFEYGHSNLSETMRESLKRDKVDPVLTDDHLAVSICICSLFTWPWKTLIRYHKRYAISGNV